MPNKRPNPWRTAGFTSIELSVTVALVGMVLALGARRVDSSAWKLDTAGQEVVQRVRAARALAVLRQHDMVVSFDINARQIIVHEDLNSDGVMDGGERVIRYTLDGKAQFVLGEAPAYAGYSGGPITFTDNTVTFTRNGSASEEGAIYVSRPGLSRARGVVVSRATGFAEMNRYNGTDWITE